MPGVTRAPNILIVDGEVRTSNRLARLLREDGFEVEVLSDGARAVNRLAALPLVDALITELSLPITDGAALARLARARNPDTSIIVLTRHPNLLDPTRFGDTAPVVLTKPLDYARLLELLGAPPLSSSAGVHLASPRF